MSNENHTPAGARRFRVVKAPDPPNPKLCPHCEAAHVMCPECERRQLIPNSFGLQVTSTHVLHHAQCHRHGIFWRRCPHYADTAALGDHAGARIGRGRVNRIVSAFACAAFMLGVVAGIALVYVQRAILAH